MSNGKTIKLLLAFAIVSLFSISICYATGVSLHLSSQVVSAGDTFTVDVLVEPDVAIAGMQFDLEFDEAKMHVDNVEEGDLFAQSDMNTYFNAGTIEFGSLSNVYGTILGAANVITPSAFATITMVLDSQDAGTSTINLKNVIVSDPEGHAVDIEASGVSLINVILQEDIFFDDMESRADGWTSSGLWHMTKKRSDSPTHSWWYGQESTGNYDTGDVNSGYLTSPSISLAGSANPVLSFKSWYRTESGTNWDKKIVQVSTDGGSTWTDLKPIDNTPSTWDLETVDLSSYAGRTIVIRFYFDTVDSSYNKYEGWYIDDVKIETENTPDPAPEPDAILSNDMESGADGWTSSGLWHMTTKRSDSPTHSWWYGQESTGNYDTGNTNSGYLTSPSISLAGSANPVLSFKSWYRTESGTNWDKKIVQVSTDGGSTWTDLKPIDNTLSTWDLETVDLSRYAGRTIVIRFYFDTVDSSYNKYEGWYIDDVGIVG